MAAADQNSVNAVAAVFPLKGEQKTALKAFRTGPVFTSLTTGFGKNLLNTRVHSSEPWGGVTRQMLPFATEGGF